MSHLNIVHVTFACNRYNGGGGGIREIKGRTKFFVTIYFEESQDLSRFSQEFIYRNVSKKFTPNFKYFSYILPFSGNLP